MTRLIAFALASGLAFAAVAAEPTATLADIQGEGHVSVNQGEEFRPASEGMRLKPGDRIMVQDDSSVELKFDDECKYKVPANRIVTIPEKSPCEGGSPVVQELNPAGNSAIGGTAGGTGNGGVVAM